MQQPIWMTAADLRYAFRVLAKNRGFTLTVVFTLALGIGAATTIFSVVNTVLLQPLGYREPDRLVLIRERIRKITPDLLAVPAPDILEFRKETAAFEDVAGWIGRPSDISGDSSRPARVDVTRVTPNIFPMLGRTAALGRTFTAAEDAQRQPVAVLSDALWRTRYAADPNILGRKILLDRAPYTVIGVMAPEFTFPPRGLGGSDGVWIPMAFTAEELKSYGDMFNYSALARLRPGVTLETAAAVLSSTSARILAQYPAEVRSQLALESVPLPLSEQVVRGSRTLVLLLGSAVLLLLLIACANVASLLLSRAAAREREFAIRAAIGAGRSRIASQWLAESLWLSLAAALLGLFAAWYGTDGLARLKLASIPRLAEVHMDARVLIVSLALSTVTALIFGTVPAWFTARADLTAGLKDGGRGSSGPGRHRVRSVLVTAEVALALMLLAGAGLLFRSFLIARAADPGIRAENVLSFRLSLPASAYPKPADNERFSLDLDRRLHALPGVLAAGYSNDLPLGGSNWVRLFTPDNPAAVAGKLPPIACSVVYGDYLQALGIPLRRGRLFTSADRDARAVILSESTARQLWPSADPIGRAIKWGPLQSNEPWYTVVGVVADVKEHALDSESTAHAYILAGHRMGDSPLWINNHHWAIRTASDPQSLAPAVRQSIASVDSEIPIERLETMQQAVSGSLSGRRVETWMVGLFAAAALSLAAIGIYGLVAYTVTQRMHEFGIRIALGATSRTVASLVLKQALSLTAVGVIAGGALSFALTRYIGSLLFGVKPSDPLTFAAVAVTLIVAAAAASLLPARRAVKVDPMIALRRN